MNNTYNPVRAFNYEVNQALNDYEFYLGGIKHTSEYLSVSELKSRRIRLEQIVNMLYNMELKKNELL